MGSSASNPDVISFVDYATGEKGLRLHLDIILSDDSLSKVESKLKEGNMLSALELAKECCEPEAHAFLDVFFHPHLAKSKLELA